MKKTNYRPSGALKWLDDWAIAGRSSTAFRTIIYAGASSADAVNALRSVLSCLPTFVPNAPAALSAFLAAGGLLSCVSQLDGAPHFNMANVQVIQMGHPTRVFSVWLSDNPDKSYKRLCVEIDGRAAGVSDFIFEDQDKTVLLFNGKPMEIAGCHRLPCADSQGWSSHIHIVSNLDIRAAVIGADVCPIAHRGGLSDAEFDRATGRTH